MSTNSAYSACYIANYSLHSINTYMVNDQDHSKYGTISLLITGYVANMKLNIEPEQFVEQKIYIASIPSRDSIKW